MDRITLSTLTRRVALALQVAFQVAHFCLQLIDRWGPPRKSSPKLTTMAKLTELYFFSVSFFKLTERNVDIKLGRHVVRGLGIDALLWSIVVWSAGIVWMDVWVATDGWMSLAQLVAVEVVMLTEMLSPAVMWVERKEGGDQRVVHEEPGEKMSKDINEKMNKDINEKMNKDINEKMNKDINEKMNKDINEKMSKDINEKLDKKMEV